MLGEGRDKWEIVKVSGGGRRLLYPCFSSKNHSDFVENPFYFSINECSV